MALSKSSLSNRIYSNLEDRILPELISQNCTDKNISDVKSKLRQEADSIAAGVIDEIQENAEVELRSEVMTLKNAVIAIIDAISSAPTIPMDGGTALKVFMMAQLIPFKPQLSLIQGIEKIE